MMRRDFCNGVGSRRVVGLLVALSALGWMMVAVGTAKAYTAEVSPWVICSAEKQSNQVVEEHAKLLSPANPALIRVGTPVTFLGESGVSSPMTFAVASSPTLLASPDIESGAGSLLAPQYKTEYGFTSTKATATPRTIYWTASFTRTLKDCEEPPVSFTLPTRTLIVEPSLAEEAAARQRQQEEGAAATAKGAKPEKRPNRQ